jgi:hemolysin activation/secretion protein
MASDWDQSLARYIDVSTAGLQETRTRRMRTIVTGIELSGRSRRRVLNSGQSEPRTATLAHRVRQAGSAAFLVALCSHALAQQAVPPSSGQILRDIERSIPSRQVSAPEGGRIEVPEAPAATSESLQQRVTVRGYRIVGNSIFDQATLIRLIAERTGTLSLTDLQDAANELTRYYRGQGYMVARAYLPQQKIEDGIVTLAVLEGRYDRIDTHGSARVSDERVKRTIGSAVCPSGSECQGALIDRSSLERGLLVLNDTPGVHAAARLSPGVETGTSTLDLDVSRMPLISGSAALDNNGDYYTGSLRASANLWVNSLAGLGDQLSLQGVGTVIHGHLGYGALGYSVPVGYSGLRFAVRAWDMYYKLGDTYTVLDSHGIAYGGDATLSYPLIRSQSANLYGTLSYGERRFHDYAETVGLSDTRRISGRVEAGLSGDFQDALFGLPAFNTYSLAYAEGRVGLDPTLSAADALTAHTVGRYDKVAVTFSRLQALFSRSALYVRLLGQSSSKNLDSYEKLALGGTDAVRAYPAGDSLMDKAILYTVEWRQRLLQQLLNGPLEGIVFYDSASGHTNATPWQVGPNSVTLHGAGGGLNWTLSRQLVLRSYVAFRGDRTWTAAPDHRVQYGLMLSAAF